MLFRSGLTTPDQSEAKVKNAMLKAARRKVVLVDHTKFGQDHFASFGNISDVDVVITDKAVSENQADELQNLGPMVIRA